MNRDVLDDIADYLAEVGLLNPELANHKKVRDLIIACKIEILKSHGIMTAQAMRIVDLQTHIENLEGED